MEAAGRDEDTAGQDGPDMSTTPKRVDYLTSARRHCKDADALISAAGRPNAGQLYGLSVECGLKALLLKMGVGSGADGTIAEDFRRHLPQLINDMTTLPDGRPASALHAAVPNLRRMHDWRIEHRYWRAASIPLDSLSAWQSAAREMLNHLEQLQ